MKETSVLVRFYKKRETVENLPEERKPMIWHQSLEVRHILHWSVLLHPAGISSR